MPFIITPSTADDFTFTDMQNEFFARGFAYLNEDEAGRTRAKRWLNLARAELDRAFLWPWREATITGAAPLTITDLGVIERVTDSNGFVLSKVDRQSLGGDLTLTGSPSSYYTDWSSGARVVAVYPVSTNDINVRYWAVTPDLTADSDAPAAPLEARYLIVDMAVRRAYRDSDNHELAAAIQQEVDSQMDSLLFNYPPGTADGPDSYVGLSFASSDW